MSHGLSQDEIDDLKEAFNMFDVDGGGKSLWFLLRRDLPGVVICHFCIFVHCQL
jgi:hypothetical protein